MTMESSTSSIVEPTSPAGSSSGGSIAPSHGLSSGASAGIGVGVGAIVLAIGIGSFLVWRRGHKKSKVPVSTHELSAEKELRKVHEIATQEIHEVSGQHTSELPA
jgi:hypothetical protein